MHDSVVSLLTVLLPIVFCTFPISLDVPGLAEFHVLPKSCERWIFSQPKSQ